MSNVLLAELGPYKIQLNRQRSDSMYVALLRKGQWIYKWYIEGAAEVVKASESAGKMALRLAELEAGGWQIDCHGHPVHPLLGKSLFPFPFHAHGTKNLDKVYAKLLKIPDSPLMAETDKPARNPDNQFERALAKANLGGHIVYEEDNFFIYQTTFAKKTHLSLVLLQDESFITIRAYTVRAYRAKALQSKLHDLLKQMQLALYQDFEFIKAGQGVVIYRGEKHRFYLRLRPNWANYAEHNRDKKKLALIINSDSSDMFLEAVQENLQDIFALSGSRLLVAANPYRSAAEDIKELEDIKMEGLELDTLRKGTFSTDS